jgi:hypothetical protein
MVLQNLGLIRFTLRNVSSMANEVMIRMGKKRVNRLTSTQGFRVYEMRKVKRKGGEGKGSHLGSSSPIPMAGGGRSDRCRSTGRTRRWEGNAEEAAGGRFGSWCSSRASSAYWTVCRDLHLRWALSKQAALGAACLWEYRSISTTKLAASKQNRDIPPPSLLFSASANSSPGSRCSEIFFYFDPF